MSYLSDGSRESTARIPPIDIFTENEYFKYNVEPISDDRVRRIIAKNRFGFE